MKRIHSGVVAGIFGLCLAAPALAHGGAGGASMNAGASTSAGASTNMSAGGSTNAGASMNATGSTNAHTATPRALGQPNQTCGSATAPMTPGNAASAPGSAFNPSGNAGTHYAGQQPQNSRNPAAVSQYDVACSHQPH
jgi:hypothetical protein